jgi:CcmD family protein
MRASGSCGSYWREMTPSEKYTAAAYLVVFLGLLAYVLIIAAKLQRLERQLGELTRELRERNSP